MENLVLIQATADGDLFSAMRQLEALEASLQGGCSGDAVSFFLNERLSLLTRALERMKTCAVTSDMTMMASRFRRVFHALQRRAADWCHRLKSKLTRAFARMGDILACLLGERVANHLPVSAGLVLREAQPNFRAALIDRITDALRALFAYLRDLACACDRRVGLRRGPIRLGASAAQFVEEADTSRGVLALRLQDGRREFFNLTDAEWTILLPLLVSPHPLGHARLTIRPQSLLTRHDANGDEIKGDAYRLKQYIHPVGRGRGGTGEYFLAPYPRTPNVVG